MVIDISRRFHVDRAYIDLPALPLPSTFSIYQAALLHIQFSDDEFLGPDWTSDMDKLKNTLRYFARRWDIGSELIRLTES
jgi:hypothetical protein